jgi:ankyrin repeat protein
MGLGPSQIIQLAAKDDIQELERILDGRPELVNAKDKNGVTALMHAVERCSSDSVRLLLRYKADPNIISTPEKSPGGRRFPGYTALTAASEAGSEFYVKWLIDAGADPNLCTTEGTSALQIAIRSGHYHPAQVLLEDGAANASYGGYNLHKAVQNCTKIIPKLIEKGADPNGTWDSECSCNIVGGLLGPVTPLFWNFHLLQKNMTEVTQLLIEHGADVHVRNAQGKSALYVMVQKAYFGNQQELCLQCIDYLLTLGLDAQEVLDDDSTIIANEELHDKLKAAAALNEATLK